MKNMIFGVFLGGFFCFLNTVSYAYYTEDSRTVLDDTSDFLKRLNAVPEPKETELLNYQADMPVRNFLERSFRGKPYQSLRPGAIYG